MEASSSLRIAEKAGKAEGQEMTPPSNLERQFMQHLQGAEWVKAITLPSSPRVVVENLLSKGWIERSCIENRLGYRITDQGLAAKKMPVQGDETSSG